MRFQFHFEVMQPMDRPAHRWDTCCRDWWGHAWGLQWEFAKHGDVRLFFMFLPAALQPILGTCSWHGLKTEIPA